jgi:2-oxoglutarate/2-oxoacid ferredoxin oxidoreductase subunit alpha
MNIPKDLIRQIVPRSEGGVFQKRFLQGNEALSEGALAAGLKFFAGYPITPSSEIAEILSVRLPRIRGTFIQMEDEIASMGAILGASLAGVKALTATSGPGFSLMQELIGYAGMAQIPCVIVNVMRAGPSTGLPTSPAQGDVMQAIWGTHGDHPSIVVAPASVQEMYYLSIWCMNLAERLRVPVILLPDEIVAHMRELLLVPPPELIAIESRRAPDVEPGDYHPFPAAGIDVAAMPALGTGFRYNVTGLVHDEDGFPSNDPDRAEKLTSFLVNKVIARTAELAFAEEINTDGAEAVIIAYGSTARSAERAMRLLALQGRKVGIFRIITLNPFPSAQLTRLAESCSTFLLAEMNRGQFTTTVRSVIGRAAELKVLNKSNGTPIPPDAIVSAIGQRKVTYSLQPVAAGTL